MDKQQLQVLVKKLNEGTATSDELEIYNAYMNRLAFHEQPDKQLKPDELQLVGDRMWQNLRPASLPDRRVIRRLRMAGIAATLLLGFSIGIYLLLPKREQWRASIDQDFRPGSDQAVLVMAGGRKIRLDSAANGVLHVRPGLTVQQQGGSLTYAAASAGSAGPSVYDTLTTPKGGVYNITLPDGTRAWLNAATSVRFPEVFGAKERRIELLYGEAYFEVRRQEGLPFRVVTPKGLVEVTGTHFNINAYDDTQVERISLLEGSVKISSGDQSVTLAPGKQAAVLTRGSAIDVSAFDIEEVVAWRNGVFMFNNASLESIMQQIERWYNIEVRYSDDRVRSGRFLGSVSRFKNVSEVLDMLEKTGNVRFGLKDKILWAYPKSNRNY